MSREEFMSEVKAIVPRDAGFVYLIQFGNSLKIGFSENVNIRINKISGYLPTYPIILGVIVGGRDKELELLNKFKKYSINREWFLDIPEIRKEFNAEFTVDFSEEAPEIGDMVVITKGPYVGTLGQYDEQEKIPDRKIWECLVFPSNREDFEFAEVISVGFKQMRKVVISSHAKAE